MIFNPKWSDEATVARLVAEEIEADALEQERIFYTQIQDQLPEPTWAEILYRRTPAEAVFEEREAVEAALRGKTEQLVEMVKYRRRYISRSTWDLVSEFLSGERNLKTGRLKGEPGRPRCHPTSGARRTPSTMRQTNFPAFDKF